MTTTSESPEDDGYVRWSVIITFLWLVAMLVGGLLLLNFSQVLEGLF